MFNILYFLWKHDTFLAIYCTLLNNSYLGIYLWEKKKQISKQNKKETERKKERKKEKKEKYWVGVDPAPSARRDYTLPLNHYSWLHNLGEKSLS